MMSIEKIGKNIMKYKTDTLEILPLIAESLVSIVSSVYALTSRKILEEEYLKNRHLSGELMAPLCRFLKTKDVRKIIKIYEEQMKDSISIAPICSLERNIYIIEHRLDKKQKQDAKNKTT